jgi:choline-sulfatase
VTENLLIIMSDGHQHNAMSCAGHFVQTPHLDALAARGMRFTNAYTPSPICVPARASFATGQHVHDLRLWDNAMPYHGQVRGWGHGLQDKGVPVESIGKLHYRSEADPAGFDAEHIPMMVVGGVGMVWGSIRGEHDRLNPPERMLGKYIGPGTSKYTDYDVSVTDRTKQWIEERAASGDARPWCLYVGLVAPHFPLVVPQEFYDMFPVDKLPPAKLHPNDGYVRHPWIEKQNYRDAENQFKDADERLAAFAAYWGLCSWLDHNVGDILGTLEDAGMGGNTTVAYTSDHGDNVGARGLWGKSNMYEEAAAIPMIVAGERVKPGTCDTTVSLIDLSEMALDHFGAELDGERPGDSLYAVAEDRADANRAVLSQYHASEGRSPVLS